MKTGKVFDQERWEAKFVALESRYALAFRKVFEAVLAGTVLGLTVLYFMGAVL